MHAGRIIAGIAALALAGAALPAAAGTVVIFAAASLKTAMDDVSESYARETGNTMRVALAGSSVLARQIQQGAPADVFISANPGWMDLLEADGLIDAGSRRDLLGNALVLVSAQPQATVALGPDLDLSGLLGPRGRLAMALVDAVPAGIYGKAALEHLGLWQAVAPQVAQADNVRAALALVALGEAPLGIVYATDAQAEPDVSVIATFPAQSHPPITYPVAGLAESDNPLKSQVLSYLGGPAARAAFARQGFTLPGEG